MKRPSLHARVRHCMLRGIMRQAGCTSVNFICEFGFWLELHAIASVVYSTLEIVSSEPPCPGMLGHLGSLHVKTRNPGCRPWLLAFRTHVAAAGDSGKGFSEA